MTVQEYMRTNASKTTMSLPVFMRVYNQRIAELVQLLNSNTDYNSKAEQIERMFETGKIWGSLTVDFAEYTVTLSLAKFGDMYNTTEFSLGTFHPTK